MGFQFAASIKFQRRVGIRIVSAPKKNITSDREITCVLERN